MPIEIRELSIKISLGESEGNNSESENISKSMLYQIKDKIIQETIEQIMNQKRANKER